MRRDRRRRMPGPLPARLHVRPPGGRGRGRRLGERSHDDHQLRQEHGARGRREPPQPRVPARARQRRRRPPRRRRAPAARRGQRLEREQRFGRPTARHHELRLERALDDVEDPAGDRRSAARSGRTRPAEPGCGLRFDLGHRRRRCPLLCARYSVVEQRRVQLEGSSRRQTSGAAHGPAARRPLLRRRPGEPAERAVRRDGGQCVPRALPSGLHVRFAAGLWRQPGRPGARAVRRDGRQRLPRPLPRRLHLRASAGLRGQRRQLLERAV